jgi:hypothetical protein
MRIKWTEEMIEYVRNIYPHYTNKEIAEMLKERYGITVRPMSLRNLHYKYKYDDKLVNVGCFKKGQEAWNKDRPMSEETREKLKDTWFKDGHTPANTRLIGSTRIDKDGYVVIKTKETGRWTPYQRHIYEQAHGVKLDKDDLVLFADGNTRNFDVDNLVRITREELLYLNQEGLISSDQDITKAGVGVARLIAKIRERERERSEKSNS